LALAMTIVLLFTCSVMASADSTTRKSRRTNHHSKTKGAIVGGVAGAVGGALIGGKKGAVIGAGAGAGAGYLIQRHRSKKHRKSRQR
jgi:hypothetical protein